MEPKWTQKGTPKWSKTEPKWMKKGTRTDQDSPGQPKTAHNPKMEQNGTKNGPKRAPEQPETAQGHPRHATTEDSPAPQPRQGEPRTQPGTAQEGAKTA